MSIIYSIGLPGDFLFKYSILFHWKNVRCFGSNRLINHFDQYMDYFCKDFLILMAPNFSQEKRLFKQKALFYTLPPVLLSQTHFSNDKWQRPTRTQNPGKDQVPTLSLLRMREYPINEHVWNILPILQQGRIIYPVTWNWFGIDTELT